MAAGGGRIAIHSPGTCWELQLTAREEERYMVVEGPASQALVVGGDLASRESGRLSRRVSRDTRRASSVSSAAQLARARSWLSRKAHRAVVVLPEPAELSEMEQLCQSLLQQEKELVSELEEAACSHAGEDSCKREMLFHKWSTRVFDPLHSHIAQLMGSSKYRELEREKRTIFQSYITHCNRQRVFLETESSEYNSLSLSEHNKQLAAVTPLLDDPLLSQQSSRAQEQQLLDVGSECEGVKAERGLDAVRWLAIKLTHIDSNARLRSQLRVQRDHNYRQPGGGHLLLPHKTPATLPYPPLSLSSVQD